MYTLLVTGDVPGASTYFNPLVQQTILPVTSGTRPTPSHEGMMIYETDTARHVKWNGIAWEIVCQSRTSFTPTLTAVTTNPTMGTGAVLAGFYSILPGNFVLYTFNIQFGTSGVAAGSGGYTISLPITATALFGNGNTGMGNGFVRDNSAIVGHGTTILHNSTTTIRMQDDTTAVTVSDAAPWTWAANDTLGGTVVYPF